MPSLQNARPEVDRLSFIVQRDGREAARAWAVSTLHIYREAVSMPGHFAADAAWRPLFERSIHEFEEWLAAFG